MMRGTAVSGGQQGDATWNAFAGIPWQVDSGKGHLERFCGDTVAGGRRERLPGTLSREFRGRWSARKATWNAFAGIPWQVGGGKGCLERFCGDSVPGGRRGDATWNDFAGIPCQVGGRKMPPDTLSREYSATLPGGKFYWDMKLNLY